MDDERDTDLEQSKETGFETQAKRLGTAAASAALATSLVGALSEPPRSELMTLPEPTPIVREYAVEEDIEPCDERETVARPSRLQRLLRLLKFLIVALALLATLLFGVLKGCAGMVGATLLPGDDEREEQTAQQTQTEDERGVALEG